MLWQKPLNIKAGTYKVEIEFTLEKDTLETALDNIFEDAMYNNFNNISESDIGEYVLAARGKNRKS